MITYPKLNNDNELYTPPDAMKYIIPYLPMDKIYWEACFGLGHMANELTKKGYRVVGNSDIDCLSEQPEQWDIFITNPPFNGNKKFFRRAIEFGKPFAILCRLEHLGGVEAYELFKDLDIQIIIPKKRINFITQKTLNGGKTIGSPFHCIWVTKGLGLDKQINYK